jgi:hypothetical protein
MTFDPPPYVSEVFRVPFDVPAGERLARGARHDVALTRAWRMSSSRYVDSDWHTRTAERNGRSKKFLYFK